MRKKILVTGGAGYIGSHTVVELFLAGYLPIIVDNLCNTSEKNLTGINKILKTDIPFHKVDCTDLNEMRNVFDIYQEKKDHYVLRQSIDKLLLLVLSTLIKITYFFLMKIKLKSV